MSNSRQPTGRRRGHLELVRGQGDARPFMHLLMNFLHRADRDRRGLYSGDLDLAAVGETVGLAAVEADARKPDFLEKFGDYRAVIGLEGQRPVTAMSISQATGIPRETVRRKLKLLLARGVIVEKTRSGYVFKLGSSANRSVIHGPSSASRDSAASTPSRSPRRPASRARRGGASSRSWRPAAWSWRRSAAATS
jgi:hypothetical protein